MKILFVLPALLLLVQITNAQLNVTKWKNVLNVPDPIETFLEFKTDTAVVTLVSDGTLIETMRFSTNKDTLRITKLFGNSPCDDQTGVYRFEINNDKLTLTLVIDDCADRAAALKTESPWTREKI